MDDQMRVTTDKSLNLRIAGNGSAPIAASIRPDVIVHITGEANEAGFAPGYVFGWLGKDGKTIYSDSLAVAESSIDAVLLPAGVFEPQGEPDVFGRQPGLVRGWVYRAYLAEAAP